MEVIKRKKKERQPIFEKQSRNESMSYWIKKVNSENSVRTEGILLIRNHKFHRNHWNGFRRRGGGSETGT